MCDRSCWSPHHKVAQKTITPFLLLSPLRGSWVIQQCAGEDGQLAFRASAVCFHILESPGCSSCWLRLLTAPAECSQALVLPYKLSCLSLLCLIWSFSCLLLFHIASKHSIGYKHGPGGSGLPRFTGGTISSLSSSWRYRDD